MGVDERRKELDIAKKENLIRSWAINSDDYPCKRVNINEYTTNVEDSDVCLRNFFIIIM